MHDEELKLAERKEPILTHVHIPCTRSQAERYRELQQKLREKELETLQSIMRRVMDRTFEQVERKLAELG